MLVLDAHTCNCVASSVMSIRNCFRPNNGLPERVKADYAINFFVLKYFCRTSTLRKIFNMKIFPTKISYNANFPIYGIEAERAIVFFIVQWMPFTCGDTQVNLIFSNYITYLDWE